MGDRTRNCKRISGASEMEEVSSTSVSLSKRSKIFKELESTSPDIEQESRRLFSHSLKEPFSPATSSNSGGVLIGELICLDESLVSRCSSNESCEIVKDSLRFVDLEAKSCEAEVSTCNNGGNKFSGEATPLSELRVKVYSDDQMDSKLKKSSPVAAMNQLRDSQAVAKMPAQAEIDQFFSVAEKFEQKRFAKKYNYDIVKDAPLEGRYQWVRLNP